MVLVCRSYEFKTFPVKRNEQPVPYASANCVFLIMLQLNFHPFPTLQTERLLLRQLKLTDASAIQQLRSNREVMRFINRPLLHTLPEAEAWVEMNLKTMAENAGINWCICLKEDAENFIGSIGFWRIEKEHHRAEIGYMLHPAYQGKGLMCEAIQAVNDYGFKHMHLHSIEAQIDPRNLASASVLKKTGFIQEAYFRENYRYEGAETYSDTAIFSLLAPDNN